MSADSLDGTNSFPAHRYKGALCGSIILSWVQGLEDRGLDLPRFFAAWGVDAVALRASNLRLPLFLARRFWEVALEHSADPAIGLELARQLDPVQMQGLAYLMQLMPDRYSALERMLHFWPLVAAHFEQQLQRDGDCVRLTLEPVNHYQLALPEVDYWLVRQLRHLRSAPGATPVLREVRLRRPEPADPQRWHRIVRAPVLFSATKDELILDPAALEESHGGGSPAIREALELSLREYGAQTETGSDLERVCAEVLHRLADNPGLKEIAGLLHMTPRTLNRSLQRVGWTYSGIVEEHRRLLAIDLLQFTDKTIAEVADQIGFYEQSSFIRAFRRWCGVTPGGYREGLK